jgi:hypothetical protein
MDFGLRKSFIGLLLCWLDCVDVAEPAAPGGFPVATPVQPLPDHYHPGEALAWEKK